ncbi:MAG: NAD-dependent malic enzyme [Legionellales bacterium]|nr:NAD-dependent malic enzyme [Legionellales bacterium]
MLDFKKCCSDDGDEYILTSIAGKLLLGVHQLNKGTAFSQEEREEFNLTGKLPARIETLNEQVKRSYKQFEAYTSDLKRNIYLNDLHDTNQVLFYKLVSEYLATMMPYVYTPIVGTAVKEFSTEFRRPRGLYLSYLERDKMEAILGNRSNPEIEVIVVTDGEAVLGIGDQGIGAIDIPIAKLMVYTLCGGIDPNRTLPIQLDVGTNNEKLLADPFYLGWRHERLRGQEYDDFIDQFVGLVRKKFPNVFLHWEDFGRDNARHNLERYQDKMCTFNDDMQGTGVVTLSALLAAVHAKGEQLRDQRIVVFGAGTAGTGIADQIVDALKREGLSEKEARACFWLIDRPGLLTDHLTNLTPFQSIYARPAEETALWQLNDSNIITLADVVHNIHPTVLIGCSAVTGAFTQSIIKEMAASTGRPIILSLSNPTERCEATPQDIIEWTEGRALIATGSPFANVNYHQRDIRIGQCNNAFVFPGLGLGLIAVQAKRLTNDTLWAACQALSEFSPIAKDPLAPLLPSLEQAREVAERIAVVVAKQVLDEGNASVEPDTDLETYIKKLMWHPRYLPYKRVGKL